MLKRYSLMVGVAVLSMALAACSSGSTSSNGAAGSPSMGSMGGMGSSAAGATTVDITASDTLKFDPSQVTVKAGEPVTFVVTNGGSTIHEFVVGDEALQMADEQQMGSGGSMSPGMNMDLPALTLSPGETQEATVTFDKPGVLLYGCHQPGHYQGGMVGTINVA